jgi:CRISPR-associated protein (TIGR03986 family)
MRSNTYGNRNGTQKSSSRTGVLRKTETSFEFHSAGLVTKFSAQDKKLLDVLVFFESAIEIKVEQTNGPGGIAGKFKAISASTQNSNQHNSTRQRQGGTQQAYQKPIAEPLTENNSFYNPYAFIAQNPRDVSNPISGDKKPDSLASVKGVSGQIKLKLRTVTPLILVDASTKSSVPEQADSYDVHREGDQGIIPETSLKGMLSSALEVITASRLRVFGEEHKDFLGYRSQASADLKPISFDRATLSAHSYLGDCTYDRTAEAAWLPRNMILHGTTEKPLHGKCYFARMRLWERWKVVKGRLDMQVRHWQVCEISGQPIAQNPISDPKAQNWDFQPQVEMTFERRDKLGKPIEIIVNGYAVITGLSTTKKHDERFFFNPAPASIDQTVIDKYQALRNEAAKIHKDEDPRRNTQWSTHITSPNIGGGMNFAHGVVIGSKITEIFPVMLPRKLHPVTPDELIHDTLKPATNCEQLSVADRAMGWVAQQQQGVANRSKTLPWAGRLRLVCEKGANESVEIFKPAFKLAVLGVPKPAQGRFYTLNNNNSSLQGNSVENIYHNHKIKLAGRKCYLNHDGNAASIKAGAGYRLYGQNPQINHKQYRQIKSWIKEDQGFSITLHFENLEEFTLAALIWVLSKPNHHFNLGGARSFGFGSVKFTELAVHVENSAERIQRYQQVANVELSPPLDENDLVAWQAKFVADTDMDSTEIKGFLASGHRYPYVIAPRENPSDEGFKWFVNNEKGRKHALQPFHDLQRLPKNPG